MIENSLRNIKQNISASCYGSRGVVFRDFDFDLPKMKRLKLFLSCSDLL